MPSTLHPQFSWLAAPVSRSFSVINRRLTAMLGMAFILSFLLPEVVTAAGKISAENSPQEILDCAAENAPSKTFKQNIDFSTIAAGSKLPRLLKTALYAQRKSKKLSINLRITEPANLAGSAFLIRERKGQDDMRVYVPALRKTRRITGSMAAKDLWGTGFSYQDIKQLYGAFSEGEARVVGEQNDAGVVTVKIEITPNAAEGAPFAKLQALIDSQSCVPLSIHYVDEEGEIIKSLTTKQASIKTFGSRQMAVRYELQDLVNGAQTVINFSDISIDEKLGAATFSPTGFHHAN